MRRPVSLLAYPALFTLLLAGAGPALAQEDALTSAVQSIEFREIGPAIMGGRVSDLAVREDNPAVWYVGFATGGLWKTENHGMSWEPLFDDQPVSSIGAVTLAPSNPNVVWVGTGEPQNRQSSPYGGGVFRSLDGGRTWSDLGLTETRHIARIVVHPRDPDVAWVAAVGHLWGANEERGVYRTRDGGESWEKVLYIDEDTGAIDLAMDPGDPSTLFAAMYQRRRTVFGFSASGRGSGLYRTLDGGDSWTELTEGLPEGDKGRMGIDVYRRDGNLVYVSVEAAAPQQRGLYRSDDRGESWQRVSGNNPRPMYFSLVRIDPGNPDRIYMGGVNLGVSDDGGRTWWEQEGYAEIHVDYHALWVDPANSNHVVVGNDGGVASSWDGARSWRHHNNLAVGQFYEIGVDMRDPYYVCGGLQDNSSWCGPSNKLDQYGIANRDWYDVSGGDGFYNQIDPTDWRWVYTESQGGNISRYNAETGETARIRPVDWPEEGEEESEGYDFNWNAPIVVSQHDPATIYMGANHLMRSRDRGQTWEEASPDLTAGIDRDTLQIFGRALSAPHLSRNDGLSRYGTITTVDESPISADVVWVGTDDGQVQLTRDGGASWSNVTARIRDLPGRRYVSRIEASAHVAGRAYVTFDGHYDDDYAPYVFRTEDFGESWQRITDGLPDHSVNVIREHPRAARLLFVGNEVGVFASVDGGEHWVRMAGGFPTAPVDDLVIHPRDNDLVVGTHARSIWIADDIGPLETLTAEVVARGAHLFPVRRATFWVRPGGWPFWGDLFFGENPEDGAMIRYHLADEIDVESVALRITDAAGEEVRTLEGPAEEGFHTVVWNLRHDDPFEAPEGQGGGFFGPPRGPTVMPGEYTVTLEAGGFAESTTFEVRLDPRVETTRVALLERQAVLMSAHALAGPARDAQDRIREMQAALRDVEELISDHEAVDDELRERVDTLQSEVRAAGEDVSELNGAVRVSGSVEGSWGPPTSDQRRQVDEAWASVEETLGEVNRLLTEALPSIYAELDRLGVRPELGEAVAVPRRPGG